MKNKFKEKNSTFLYDNELDLKEMFNIVWAKKLFVTSLSSIIASLAIIYSLNLPNIYTSESLLAPASAEDSMSSKLGSLSSFASIGGLSLSNDSTYKSLEAIERINSFDFFSTYFLPNVKLENIIAVKEWVPKDNILIYDQDIFDSKSNKWVREVSYPMQTIPSEQEAFEVYKEIMSITQDNKSTFVTLSIDHKSPLIAKKWVEIIIFQINDSMQKFDAKKSEKSIAFLNKKSLTTNIQSLRDATVNLLENQMQILMLTSSSDYYVFKVINSPLAPEKKSSPRRALICIIGGLVGIFISILIVIIQHYRKSEDFSSKND